MWRRYNDVSRGREQGERNLRHLNIHKTEKKVFRGFGNGLMISFSSRYFGGYNEVLSTPTPTHLGESFRFVRRVKYRGEGPDEGLKLRGFGRPREREK